MQPPESEVVHHNSGSSSTSIHVKTNGTNHDQPSIENPRFCSNLLLKKKKKKNKKIKSSDEFNYNRQIGSSTTTTSCSSSSSPQSHESVPAGKTSKRRHLSMFCNLINCGAVNTNDAVQVRFNRDSNNNDKNNKDIIIRKENRENAATVGSAGLFRTCMDQHKYQNHASTTATKRADDRNQGAAHHSAYRAICWPHCSHCRKQFKPEKLHSHMKSCKGLKALSKSTPASVSKMMP